MGNTDKQGAGTMQCRQAGNAAVCAECGRPKSRWMRRWALRLGSLAVLVLVLSAGYAVATGRPVPDVLGEILGICVHMLMGF